MFNSYLPIVFGSALATIVAVVAPTSTLPYPKDYKQRIGAAFDFYQNDTGDLITRYDVDGLGIGWYHEFHFTERPENPPLIEYVATVWRPEEQYKVAAADFAERNPGLIWFIGNEPDNAGQTNMPPHDYAVGYHEYYHLLKDADPTAKIAIGGIIQPSTLRLRYLDEVLSHYRRLYGVSMPIDILNTHAYIMPENCGSGAGFPVGVRDVSGGRECEYWNYHADLNVFKSQLIDFRRWQKASGYQDKPLIVSEYGVMLTPGHGYNSERVGSYMVATMDWMLTAGDCEIGLIVDDCRLVQRFAWFSINHWNTNGTLFQRNGGLTAVGERLKGYIEEIGMKVIETATPTATPTHTTTFTLTPTSTSTETVTPTYTPTPTLALTLTLTPSPTATLTSSLAPTATTTPTSSATVAIATTSTSTPSVTPTSTGCK